MVAPPYRNGEPGDLYKFENTYTHHPEYQMVSQSDMDPYHFKAMNINDITSKKTYSVKATFSVC